MLKCAGKPAYDFESEALPERDGTLVRAYHKIELHGLEAAIAGSIEGVRTHRASYASAGCPRSGDVPAIGHVRAPALLVGL